MSQVRRSNWEETADGHMGELGVGVLRRADHVHYNITDPYAAFVMPALRKQASRTARLRPWVRLDSRLRGE